jgi:UrcA family protein
MTTLRNSAIALVASLSASLAAVAPVHADAPVPQLRISYADLDLNSSDGQKQLSRRVHGAASEVCENLLNDPARFQYNSCRKQALNGARKQLADAGITAAI